MPVINCDTQIKEGNMADKKEELIDPRFEDLNRDGVDRRGFLKCMAWAGTGLDPERRHSRVTNIRQQ